MAALSDHGAVTEAFRWDFVTDPPTRLLAELDLARTRLRRGQFKSARRSANRLLTILEAKLDPATHTAGALARMDEIRADGLAVRAIAASRLGRTDAVEAVAASIAAYEQLHEHGVHLRPPALAGYGMVLALANRDDEAVDPLVHATEAGEDVLAELVCDVARRLAAEGSVAAAVRLLRTVHARYPSEPTLAAGLAEACAADDQVEAAADAHVAAGALFAEHGRFAESLEHFSLARTMAPDHPLAALGRCQALLVGGQIAESLHDLDRLRSTKPNLAGAHAVTALALALLGRLSDALGVVDDALTTFPDDPWLMDTRVRLLLGAGDDSEALAAVERALEIDPTDRIWRGLRAEIQLALGVDTDDAIETFRDLAMSMPDSIVAVERLASALEVTGRTDEAHRVVERALLERPYEQPLIVVQVRLLSELGRHEEAAAAATAAIERGMPRSMVGVPLATSLFELGQYAAALETADETDPRDPEYSRLRRVRGLALYHLERHAAAVEQLSLVYTPEGGDSEVADGLAASLTGLATRMLAEGDRTGALAALEQAVEVDPRNIQARKLLAEAFRRQGEYLRALEQADRGLETDPDNAWLLGTRGQILEALGEDDRAEADLRRTVQLDGKLAWARTELGDLLRVKRRYAEAIAHLSAAIEASPSDPWPLASKGAAEYALDHYDEALRLLTAALDLTENYAWAHAVKAAVLGDVDELADAMAHSERGLHLDPSMGWAWTHLGWILLLLATDGGHDLAVVHRSIDAHREGVERQRRALPALAGLGEALTVAGQTDDAAALFVEAIRSAEAAQVKLDADGMATLGWCHLRLGHHEQAIDALARAMSLDTTHVGASFDLALALLCANRTEVALEEYMQALARVRSVRHQGRRRSLLRAARTSLQLVAPPDLPGRAEVRELLIQGGDHGADRASRLQMPYA